MNNTIFFKRQTNDWFFLVCFLAIPLGMILAFFNWKFILLTLGAVILLIIQEDTLWLAIRNSFKKSK